MPTGKYTNCKHYPDCKFRAPHKSLLEHHYKNECDFEEEIKKEIVHWVPHGVLIQNTDAAVLVAQKAAAFAAKQLVSIDKEAAIIAGHAAAASAAEIAKKVSMCGRETLKSLKVFSKKDDKNKFVEIYPKITKTREARCPALKETWMWHDTWKDGNYEENRIDSMLEEKNFTITYKSCSCQEHYTLSNRQQAEDLYKRYVKIRRGEEAMKHYWIYCPEIAQAFKNKNLKNPMYKRYAEKFEISWDPCRYCQAEFTSKQSYEFHEWKCKYNPKNLMQIPIFKERDNVDMLQYDFLNPVTAFVNKKDIKRLINASQKEVIAYSLDADMKPSVRYTIHQVKARRKPDDYNSDNPTYPFKHLYCYTEDTQISTDSFNWIV
tara:strand:+ start:384 stop:1511 length:1128 start_codon:yes stop_codon:yes gene_type:complete